MPIPDPNRAGGKARFETTSWSVVLAAGRELPESEDALAELYQRYWHPLFAFARRRGASFDDAQESTQAFFHALIDRAYLADITRSGGRFRSFLLTAFTRFLANQHRATTAVRRGGKLARLDFDFDRAEADYQASLADLGTPEQVFERRWALGLIERSMAALKDEYSEAGNAALFEHLRRSVLQQQEGTYREIGDELGLSEPAYKMAIHRFRQRLGERLREEIRETLDDPSEVEAEIRALFAAVRSS